MIKPPAANSNKSREIRMITTSISFDKAIGRLNKILYREKHGGGKNTRRLINALIAHPDEDSVKENLIKYLRRENTVESVNYLFEEYKLDPFIGDIDEGVKFSNKDIVIGLKGTKLSYRVDCNEHGLHINFLVNDDIKVAIYLASESKRFGLDTKNMGIADRVKLETYRANYIKFKFWIKMTLGFYLRQKDVKSAFSPFLKMTDYTFDALKDEILGYFYGVDAIAVNLINSCKNEKEFINLFFDNKKVRDTIGGHLVNSYTKEYMPIPENDVDSEASTSSSSVESTVELDDFRESRQHRRK